MSLEEWFHVFLSVPDLRGERGLSQRMGVCTVLGVLDWESFLSEAVCAT